MQSKDLINQFGTDNLSAALGVLSAMITPVVLIMASSSLILTTSQRLSRSIDRVRKVSDRLKELPGEEVAEETERLERRHLTQQLLYAIKRARLLQRAMTCLYLTLSIFVATAIMIGILEVVSLSASWAVVLLGIGGAMLLLYASLLLVKESRLAISAVNSETKFAVARNNLSE